MSRHKQRSNPHDSNIPEKANRVLNIILIILVLIGLRLWHLAVIQYEARAEESRRPQRRVVIEPARRATIRDRFNIPLAVNKVQYQASILYSQLRSIPSFTWVKDKEGKRIKQFKRKEYIADLSKMLARELQMDAGRLEDLIHAKAAMYYNLPFVIKEDINEKEYYRLKMLEKDWVGIQVQCLPKRTYPLGKVGCDIVGYMGAINRQEYELVVQEIKALDTYIQSYEAGEEPTPLAGISHPGQARKRLKELQELAYSVNDYVGKMGIEGRFEEQLRGYRGKKSYYSDARGNFLRELPGSRAPLPGNRYLLTISAELQEYAETLLMQNERIRETKLSHVIQGQPTSTKQPWIKGGAIIAMDPHTGEILAMASYPRFDPNDFIVSGNADTQTQKRDQIKRWFESEEYIGQIWDQKRLFERERYDDINETIFDDTELMTWERYLEFVLAPETPVRDGLIRIRHLGNAIQLQKAVADLLELSGQNNIYWLFDVIYQGDNHIPYGRMTAEVRSAIEQNLDHHSAEVAHLKAKIGRFLATIPQHYDKALLVDLCRLAVNNELFSDNLIKNVGHQSISTYRNASAAMASVESFIRGMIKSLFHDEFFSEWRLTNEQAFIKQKRLEEVLAVRYPKPYIDYLDTKENQMFQEFWLKNRWQIISAFIFGKTSNEELEPYTRQMILWHEELKKGAHQELNWVPAYHNLQEALSAFSQENAIAYMQTLRGFNELNRPLLGRYRHLRKHQQIQLEKHLAMAFYPTYGFGYGRPYTYRQAATQGSLFKLVVAYAALTQRYTQLGNPSISASVLNPLEINEQLQHHGKEVCLGSFLDGTPIPKFYKGGRLVKSSSLNHGRVDLLKALEVSSNPYFSLLASDYLNSPHDLIKAARNFSFGSKTGVDLPAEIHGHLPTDVGENRTGLYSLAIGQHTLVVTPLQTSVMLSAIANGGKVVKPKIVGLTVGPGCFADDDQIACPHRFSYQENLALVGIDFPLFTATSSQKHRNRVDRMPTGIRRQLFMPAVVREMLLEGMHRAVIKMHQPYSISSLSRFYRDYPEAISDYIELKDQLVGKTSTSESMESIDLDLEQGTNLYTHVWFGGISFDPEGTIDKSEAFLIRDGLGEPELVVVVYLRYGHFGKETVPVAAQIVQKWREIKKKHGV